MRSMLERDRIYPSYDQFRPYVLAVAQEKVVDNITRKDAEERPDLLF